MGEPSKTKRTRRPKPLRFRGHHEASAMLLQYSNEGHETIVIVHTSFKAREARKLAGWLERAATYLEPTP